MIRERATRLLSRLRRQPAPVLAPPADPPRQWSEELTEAGTTAADWIDRRQSAGRLFVDLSSDRINRLRVRHPDLVNATMAAAERVMGHEFDLLGSGPYIPVDPDRPDGLDDTAAYRPVDWYLDPIAGARFPRGVPLAGWDFDRMRPAGADIKLPWELARCQHWPLLGQAFRLSGEERFAREIDDELRDFMVANPVGTAVNWVCTMDVALRAANWALALELIRPCGLSHDSWLTAYEALFDHGAFIERHLENHYEVTSNHFLSNVVGLFYVAAVFRDLPCGKQWNRQCREWLVQEMDRQVLADGADYESSVPYHRLVTELFLGAARVADASGEPLPGALLDRLEVMIDVLAAVLRPDGLMPQVGDADDGRLHILSGYGTWKPQDPRHLFGPAASMFQRAEWIGYVDARSEWETAWWGLDAPSTGSSPTTRPALRHLPDAGLTVFRWDADYLLITNGIVGTGGFGNHKHNDLLGFEYHAANEAVIVDPGSYVYTSNPTERNLFRSTRVHNTVTIDEHEQNDIRPEWLFRMFEKASPEHLVVRDHGDALEYRGRHQGYTRLPEPVVHERTFRLVRSDGSVVIADVLEGSGTHSIQWHFHFAPGVAIEAAEANRIDISASSVRLRLTLPPGLTPSIVPGWYSPSYGVRLRCMALDLRTVERISGRREFTFQLARR